MPGSPLVLDRCRSYGQGDKALDREQILQLLPEIKGWNIIGNNYLRRTLVCKDFDAAVQTAARITPLADAESHHPELHITNYRYLTIELTTHSVKGLTKNDFIMAAKIDRVLSHATPFM